ncbi:hypothetical protein INT46_005058 [Mucor plumbeus]|uniref:Uncharacterized protein n=1 Tax=Mucor plumbeus TaxID=97098 RepID=A0A8H7RB09_9FUNG|nr:hypothetical protein INT46_005058 [Mucor plumbeus]
MFYSNQFVEKPLPKSLPKALLDKKNDKTNKALNSLLSLPAQRFYNAIEETNESRRISINIDGEDIQRPKENTMDILMHRSIQKATWTDDPLRLCFVETKEVPPIDQLEGLDQEKTQFQSMLPFNQEETLPYTFKPKSQFLYKQLLSQLYIIIGRNQWITQYSPQMDDENEEEDFDKEYLDLAFELPFATAALIPPTPPPRGVSSTPACSPPIILPIEAYSDIHEWGNQDSTQAWLYTREEGSYCDQSLMTSSPHASTNVFYFENDEQQHQQEVAEESWEAIFHPLSTFKHNKGELEYYAWDSTNLSVAAALVAQRVTNPTSHLMDNMSTASVQATTIAVEATIPQLMPTPPLKPSPVLTIASTENDHVLERDGSEINLVDFHKELSSWEKLSEEDYYYDMLQKIRRSNSSSLDESRSTLKSTDISIMDKYESQQKGKKNAQKSSKRHELLLGRFNHKKPTTNTNTTNTLNATATTISTITTTAAHNDYMIDDEKTSNIADPETLLMKKPCYWTKKRLFWSGFVCPLLWYYGSIHMKASNNSRLLDLSDLRWQKKCRLAALYFSIILSVIILVISIKIAGSAGIRQTQSDTIRAVIAD